VEIVDFEVGAAAMASALSGFRPTLRKARGLLVDETPAGIAVAVVSNDIASVGRLLERRDGNMICVDDGNCTIRSFVAPWSALCWTSLLVRVRSK
jgi:hypothetical protein